MGRKRKRKRASKSTDADESSESQAKRRSSSTTRSKGGPGPLTGTAAFDQGIGDDINALTGRPEGFNPMVEANQPDFEPLPTGPDAHIQRALEGTDTTQDEVPGTVLDVLGQGGTPLDGPIQRALEERMDADFSNVRIHTGGKAAQAAEAIDAKAFTCGNDIVFNAGEYDTESPEGQHLLAHELAHVKQQNGGATISMMPQEGGLQIDPDPQLEREADEAAAQALSGEEPVVVNRMGTDVHVQRASKDWNSGESVYDALYEDGEYDLEELGIDPDDFDIDEATLGKRVLEGLKEGSLRGVIAGTIAAGAAVATGGVPAVAGGAAAASAIATTTAASSVFAEDGSVPEQALEQMSGAVAKSEAFAEQAAQNDHLAETLASSESFVSKLASKLDALTGDDNDSIGIVS